MLYCLLAGASATWAQTVKNITVSQGNSYTDHLSLREDSRDMDLMVKFIFNEQANTLNVSLISYRDIFVFPTETSFKQAFKGGKKIKPEKLPFVVNTQPDTKYILSKEYKRSLPIPNKKHIFHQWINFSGMQANPMEYKMVNDFVSQDFVISNEAEAVTVTLRDVLMMEKDENDKKKYTTYNIVWGKDLNTTYQIFIERNPCFGKEEEIAATAQALEGVTNGYNNLKERFGTGVVANKESLANFKEMKNLLLSQYPAISKWSACPDIQEKRDKYNNIVSRIKSMNCRIRTAASAGGGRGGKGKAKASGEGVDAGFIQTQARQIDTAVSKWLNSKDKAERDDIKRKCKEIISTVKSTISQKGIKGEKQRNAVTIFNEAVKYFYSTCNR